MGRVMAVFSPANAVSMMASTAVAGLLASTALHGFHATVAGLHMGPYDTIFTVSGLLIIAAGLGALFLLPHDREPVQSQQKGAGTPGQ